MTTGIRIKVGGEAGQGIQTVGRLWPIFCFQFGLLCKVIQG